MLIYLVYLIHLIHTEFLIENCKKKIMLQTFVIGENELLRFIGGSENVLCTTDF